MISTKIGQQTWSKSEQRHDFGDDHSVRYAAAQADPVKADKGLRTDKPGDKSVGDVLNGIANPGGDLSKTKRKAHNTLDKDDFLKLMLTQMKNQDPMSPLQSHEMAAQLAQFTSLEQLYNVNKNLEGLTKAQDPVQKYEALNFLGKTIKADTRQVLRQPGDQGSELRFNLMADAQKIKLTVADETGQVVKTVEFGNLKKGDNRIVWNGTDDLDREVKPGKYMFNVEAENGGKKIGVITETKGTITGVNYTPEGPMLMVGDQRVRLQDVQKIEDDGLKLQQKQLDTPAPKELPPEKVEEATAKALEALTTAQAPAQPIKPNLKPETKEVRDLGLAGASMPIEMAMAGGGIKNANSSAMNPMAKFRKP